MFASTSSDDCERLHISPPTPVGGPTRSLRPVERSLIRERTEAGLAAGCTFMPREVFAMCCGGDLISHALS